MKLRKILFLIGSVLALSSPSVFSNEKSNDQKTFGLKVAVYVSSSPATKFQGATHLAFGAKDLEIVSDCFGSRLMYRERSKEPFKVSPLALKKHHSLVYHPADQLYYLNDTDHHRIIAFKSPARNKISAQTKKIAGLALDRPHDVVLDPETGWIYTINPNSGHVFRFKAIGKGESVLKVPVQGYSRALTFVNGKLYVINSAKGRVVEVVDWEKKEFKIYDSFDPTKRTGPAGSWKKTGLVLNDLDFFDGYFYATSYFTKSYARGTDPDEHKFIRFKKLEDLVSGDWTDLSHLVPKGMTPYYLTTKDKKLYLAIFNHESPGSGDSILSSACQATRSINTNPLSPPCISPNPGFRDLSAKSKFLAV